MDRERYPANPKECTSAREEEGMFTSRTLADSGLGQTDLLPSPASSGTYNKKTSENGASLPPGEVSETWARVSSQDGSFEGAGCHIYEGLGRKRKRAEEAKDSTSRLQHDPAHKRVRSLQLGGDNTREEEETCRPIEYWARTGRWPKKYFQEDEKMSQTYPQKRPRSTSYSQSVKDGDNPRAYTPQYEQVLEKAGIFMVTDLSQAIISATYQQLYDNLLSGDYEVSHQTLFQDDEFRKLLRRVRNRNETRIFRDVTPLIVPSAELLYIHGDDHLEHLTEELNAEWIKCSTLAGPRPKPDLAVGLMSSAFTDEELLKLKHYSAPNRAIQVTDNMYFPFLMCEAKCGDQAINRADRQNAHSSSIAINAIVQLYRALPAQDGPGHDGRVIQQVEVLDKKILCFSVSHDDSMVKIYGHYASLDGEKTTFHRDTVRIFDLASRDGRDRLIAYNFTRKVYDTFASQHLDRIRTAIAQLPNPPSESSASEINVDADVEGEHSHELIASASSSRDTAGFKIPSLPPSVRVQKENDRLKDQVDMLLRQQQEQQRQQQEQQRQQQEQQRQQQEQQRQQQEQISKLQDLLVEQKDQFKEQKDQHREQTGYYKEVIELLKQRVSTNG
ncbi:MAG: hypothetical protein M1825_005073 [Sarcosagium campestre]|nr:MAG: hypothetical protein M1825_005073 [Sarcosagium campestre]